MDAWRRLERWCSSGDFSRADLTRYRLVYGLALLAALPTFDWVAAFPQEMYAPPPGPFELVGSLPPREFFLALQVLVALACALLVCGLLVNTSSWTITVCLVVGYGFTYSVGKIDHTIFLALTPVFLSLAGWDGRREVAQWPLRLFAVLVGAGFATAVVPKILSGWLDPSDHAVQGHVLRRALVNGKPELFEWMSMSFGPGAFWETLDYATVALETSLVFACLSWRLFRLVLATATTFHLAVMAMMNIAFFANVIAYGSFFRWSGWPGSVLRHPSRSTVRTTRPTVSRPVRIATAMVLATAALLLRSVVPDVAGEALIVVVGAALGTGYLLVAVTASRRDHHLGPDPRVRSTA